MQLAMTKRAALLLISLFFFFLGCCLWEKKEKKKRERDYEWGISTLPLKVVALASNYFWNDRSTFFNCENVCISD